MIVYEDSVKDVLQLWEESVLATHDFLHENDFLYYKEKMPELLTGLIIFKIKIDNVLAGFAAVRGKKLEMLFVSPSFLGKGCGSRLLAHALEAYNIKYVDVNGQNQNAYRFYKAKGFRVTGKFDSDSPFCSYPVLSMKLDKPYI